MAEEVRMGHQLVLRRRRPSVISTSLSLTLATPSLPTTETHTPSLEERDVETQAQALKPVLMEAVQYVWDELDTVYESIAKTAKDHIHSEFVCILSL